MLITICILILVYSILNKPINGLLEKVKSVNWEKEFNVLLGNLKAYAQRAGRALSKPLLTFYYIVQEGKDITLLDRILIYAAIAYIVIPNDLLPHKVLGWIGLLDDATVIAYVYSKVSNKLTYEIRVHVEETLDNWFGPEDAVSVE